MNSDPRGKEGCEFCDEFAGGSANSFALRYGGELSSRTILVRDGFRVLPSIGQIVPGYLLLVPEGHFQALADMSSDQLRRAENLKAASANRIREKFGDCLFFEHGARTPNAGGCGVSHAHLHMVPFPAQKDPVDELIRAFQFERISDLSELKHIPAANPYLYYESARAERYVFFPEFIPSQYVRRLLAEALGTQAWDWRQCQREDALIATLADASRALTDAR